MSQYRKLARALFVGALALVLAAPAAAQQTESRIVGRISDANGGVLPGVTVTITAAQTGAVRTAVTDADGRYTVTNLAPGEYEVARRAVGLRTQPRRDRARGRRHEAARPDARRCRRDRGGHGLGRRHGDRHDLGEARRQRLARGTAQPAGQRPQLRQPHDPRHRGDDRRQRRLVERPLQRQVEPAELPELRRRRRHLRLGREPRLPQCHRLAVPAADVDGVDRRVPRQLRPGAGGERPRLRRQHHRHQQERQQPVQRIDLQLLPQRCARLGEQVRRQEAAARLQPVRRLARRPDRRQQDVLLRQLRGPEAGDRPQLHRSRPERRGDSADPGRRAGRQRPGPEPGPDARGGAAARRLPAGDACRRPIQFLSLATLDTEAEQTEHTFSAASITASPTISRSSPACSTATARSTRPTAR